MEGGRGTRHFTSAEWLSIMARPETDLERYGPLQREYDSILLGSFNIRRLGSSRSRSADTWELLADIRHSFALLCQIDVALGTLDGAALAIYDSDGWRLASNDGKWEFRASRIVWDGPGLRRLLR